MVNLDRGCGKGGGIQPSRQETTQQETKRGEHFYSQRAQATVPLLIEPDCGLSITPSAVFSEQWH